MSFEMIAWFVGTGVTVLSLLLLVVQHHYKQSNQFMSTRYDSLENEIKEMKDELKQLREDMNNDFVRVNRFDNTVNNFRADLGKVFDQIGSLSNDLHELIGTIRHYKNADS